MKKTLRPQLPEQNEGSKLVISLYGLRSKMLISSRVFLEQSCTAVLLFSSDRRMCTHAYYQSCSCRAHGGWLQPAVGQLSVKSPTGYVNPALS